MPDHGHRKARRQEVDDLVFLLKEALQLGVLRVGFFYLTSSLVLGQEFVSLHGSTLEDDVDAVGLELVDERLELPKEVEHDRSRAHLETATSSVTLIHEVDTQNRHVFIIPSRTS